MADLKRNILKLISGTVSAQIIAFAAAPILTRLYSPADYGVLGLYIALTTIVVMIATGRFHFAIVLPQSDDEAQHLVVLSLVCAAASSAITLVVVVLVPGYFTIEDRFPGLIHVLWLAPLSVAARGTLMTLQYWRNRQNEFSSNAMSVVADSSAGSGSAIVTAFALSADALTLVGSRLLGNLAAIVTAIFSGPSSGSSCWPRELKPKLLFELAKRYRRFPLITSWSAGLNTVSYSAPVIVFAAIFENVVVGFYTLAERIVVTPVALLGGAISQALYRHGAVLHRDGEDVAETIEALTCQLITISLPPMVALMFVAPELFAIAFGSDWTMAGNYTQILSVYALTRFVAAPFSNVTAIYHRQDIELTFNIVLCATRCGALVLGALSANIWIALYAMTAASCIAYGYLFVRVCAIAGASIRRIAREQTRALLWTISLVSIALATSAALDRRFLLGSVAFSLLGYFSIELRPLIRKIKPSLPET